MKLPSPVEEPFYFTYGKIIHKIAEEYVKGKEKTPLGKITLDVLEGRIPIGDNEDGSPKFAPKIPPEYLERLPEHIRALAKITTQLGTDGETEFEFLYDLEPPNKRCVKGFIDRLFKKGEKYCILDYKTSKRGMFRKTRGNIAKDLQLRTYARVVQKTLNVPAENIMAGLYYLEGGEIVGAKFSDKSLEQAEKELLYTFKQIENTPEDKAWGNVGEWCSRCDYRKMCPFYRMV